MTPQWAVEREALEESLANVQVRIQASYRAQEELDKQKQENLDLKETISRLNHEVEEMRIRGTGGHFRSLTSGSQGTDSLAGTMTRSLGDMLSNAWAEEEEEEEQEQEQEIQQTKDGVRVVYKTVTIHTEKVSFLDTALLN